MHELLGTQPFPQEFEGVRPSAEPHVENHHDGESDHHAHGCPISMTTGLRLGNDFFHDDEDHGSGRKRQSIRQEWLGVDDSGGSDHTSDRLDDSGRLTIHECLPCTHSLSAQWQRNRRSFGEVLDADSDRQGDCACQRGTGKAVSNGSECYPDRQTLGNVV